MVDLLQLLVAGVSLGCVYAACATSVLKGRCPNCGGELMRQPVRPVEKLGKYPVSTERVYKPQGCGKAA